MTRIALIAALAALVTSAAVATTPLEVTVSDRGAQTPHSPEAERIFAELAAEGK
jgi:hypothetical protein